MGEFYSLIEIVCWSLVVTILSTLISLKILDKWFMPYRCFKCDKELNDANERYSQRDRKHD